MPKLLVIEDSALFLQSLKIWLEVNGMQAICSLNNQLGLQLVKQEIPDLIICDIRMLGFDANKILNALRQDLVTTKIPLILLTSTDSERRRAMELEADDCLSRFCTFEQLIRAIKTQLKKSTRVTCSVNV
jgi:CheY-like chemotaxis protein